MIVVAIIGVLAALAIYGVRKYLTSAKSAEARTALGRMAKDAQSVFERELLSQAIVPINSPTFITRALCDDAPPVPGTLLEVANGKYQSSPADWRAGGWDCLKFSMSDPQYYLYSYSSSSISATPGETFTATANGDLDGDTIPSTFEFFGRIQSDTTGMVLTLADQIRETDADE